jgi:thiosulfate/3-mercaptopyruvate sulfurtransferase
MHPLIDPEAVLGRLGQVRLYDLRWSLTDPSSGRAAYEDGHLPGALFVDLDRDLSASPGIDGRHPLPTPEVFGSTLGRLGISPADTVVVYDDRGGAIAARMWWMLRSIGHSQVAVLDGGYGSWVEAGHPVETGWNAPEPATYPTPAGFAGVATLGDLAGRTIVDARSPERYRGESEPVDPKAGHIPGAINLPTEGNLSPDGKFLGAGELRQRYASVAEDPVMSCGSGVTACHDALAMVVAGYEMPDVYIGSFSEWSRRDLPVETRPST